MVLGQRSKCFEIGNMAHGTGLISTTHVTLNSCSGMHGVNLSGVLDKTIGLPTEKSS